MHTSEVQRLGVFEEFHMSGRAGRKKMAHGGKSTVDSIIWGRDIDFSGETQHGLSTGRSKDHAGKPSQPKPDVPFRKPGVSNASTVDSIVWGRDFDQSGAAPHEDKFKKYDKHAGVPAGLQPMMHHEHRPLRKGVYSMKSTMDETLFGRDLDNSGPGPHSNFEDTYKNHAGLRSANQPDRPLRKPNCSMQASVDEVVFGKDTDRSGPSPHREHMQNNYGAHAGLKTDGRVQRPYRKNGISSKATVDDVVFHRDIDASGPDPQTEHFTRTYKDHAGRISGGRPRTVAKHIDPRDPSYAKGKQGTAPAGSASSPRLAASSRGTAPSDAGSSSTKGPRRSSAGSNPGSSLATGRQLSEAAGSSQNLQFTPGARKLPSRSSGGSGGARPVDERTVWQPTPVPSESSSEAGLSFASRSSRWAGYACQQPRSSRTSRA